MSAEILSFETGRPAELVDDEPSLVVDVEGYEAASESHPEAVLEALHR